MISPSDKDKLLEIFEEMPIVSAAVRRARIAKATVYRWRLEDGNFAEKMDTARKIGKGNINDLAESRLISAISKGQPWAIRYWLESNKKRYLRPKKPIDMEMVNHKPIGAIVISTFGEKDLNEEETRLISLYRSEKHKREIRGEDISPENLIPLDDTPPNIT